MISDTHGLVRPEALAALDGVDLIVHAGDIGAEDVLERLRAIAPTYAVRGNNDNVEWARELPLTQIVEAGAHRLYLLHEITHLDVDPAAAQLSAVIYGHSHKPLVEYRSGVLYLNPGSAGPRRFRLPIALARLRVGDQLTPELITLEV